MVMRRYRRSFWRRHARRILITLAAIALLDLFVLLNRYKTFQSNLTSSTVHSVSELPALARNQKILICAQFWTGAKILVQHWNDDLLALIETLGRDNVYVSIYESGSFDNTEDVLRQLDARLGELGIHHRVVLDPTTHADEVAAVHDENTPGWIHTPRSGELMELRRIPYLAKLRNKVLEPLTDQTVLDVMFHDDGRNSRPQFDKILFLNDVHFRPSDVLTLLSTNSGSYTAACALDFQLPPRYYDTFVLRDEKGYTTATDYFPYFRTSAARKKITSGLPVPVTSCWNGMIAMDAAPFYADQNAARGDMHQPVRYRGTPDTLGAKSVEGSECCLVHADLLGSGQADQGIWVNPAVRVGYSRAAYDAVHDTSVSATWMSANEYIMSIYHNRVQRLLTLNGASPFSAEWAERRAVQSRLEAWREEGRLLGEERVEPGEYCLVHEMHTLIWNGWAHVWEKGWEGEGRRNRPLETVEWGGGWSPSGTSVPA